ncbi:MAG: RHS repeat-associated core domain-containing protein, partial [Planctomycetota bacterium]
TTTGSTVRNQIKYTYGTHGQITKSEQDHSGAVGGTEPSVQYAYDETASSNVYEDGLRRESVTYPDGSAFFYGYDSSTQGSIRDRRSQVAEIRETNASGQQLVAYEYTGGGRVAVSAYTQPDIHQHADRDGDGDYEIWDRFGRVMQSCWRPTTGSGANYLDRVDYGNDRTGNRTYRNIRVDQISGATTDQRDQAYSYDGLDRLIDTDEGTSNDTTGAITTKTFEQQWKLDQLGNWEEFDQDENGNGTWDLEQDRTHNDANEVTAIGLQSGGAGANWADPAFDAAGNMTTIPNPDTLTASYTGKFDAWNRLVSLDSGIAASYEYDGLNRRIKRVESSTTTHFYYNEAWQCLEERSTEGGTATKQFVWGAQYVDELVLRDRDADANSGNGLEERLYALQEAQYNVTALVNTSGSVQQRFVYTSYGVSTVLAADMSVSSDSYAWEHRYTGCRLDSGTGLQLNRNRYYHPEMGRWCSRDPLGFVDGLSVYRSYTGLTDGDPYGTKTTELVVKQVEGNLEPSCPKPEAFVKWRFSLKRWPCRTKKGFFVQHVVSLCAVSLCNPTDYTARVEQYWEGWSVSRSRGRNDVVFDYSLGRVGAGTKGALAQFREVRFYCVAPTGTTEQGLRPGEILESEKHKETPKRVKGPCTTSSGDLPATEDVPGYWSRQGAAGPGYTHFGMAWNCCCNSPKAVAWSFPMYTGPSSPFPSFPFN